MRDLQTIINDDARLVYCRAYMAVSGMPPSPEQIRMFLQQSDVGRGMTLALLNNRREEMVGAALASEVDVEKLPPPPTREEELERLLKDSRSSNARLLAKVEELEDKLQEIREALL